MTGQDAIASITVLSGFLGAGKTSLLNHLLSADHGLKVGVLVNDFGAVNVDASLIVGVHGETMALTNGCVCCNIREDLMAGLQQMLSRPDPPQHVLLETSGVSDPSAVVQTLQAAEATGWVRLDAMLVVVDADNFTGLSRRDRRVTLAQVRVADIIILNKVDLVGDADLDAQEAELRRAAPRARVLRAEHGRVAAALVFGTGASESAATSVPDHEHDHDHDHDHAARYWTWSWRTPLPVSSRKLRRAVNALPANVFRAKGTVHLASHHEHRAVLHVVGRRAELNVGRAWDDEPPNTAIVVIGSGDALDPEHLQAAFEACVVAPGERGGPVAAVLRWVRGR